MTIAESYELLRDRVLGNSSLARATFYFSDAIRLVANHPAAELNFRDGAFIDGPPADSQPAGVNHQNNVMFQACRFHCRFRLYSGSFAKLTLSDCEIRKGVTANRTRIEELSIIGCDQVGEVVITGDHDCEISKLAITRCVFSYIRVATWIPIASIRKCDFGTGQVEFDFGVTPSRSKVACHEFRVDSCAIRNEFIVKSDPDRFFCFVGCQIYGRIHVSSFASSLLEEPKNQLQLTGCVIAGDVDLADFPFTRLDLYKTRLSSGRVFMPLSRLHLAREPNSTWQSPISNRPNYLEHCQISTGYDATTQEDWTSLAEQFRTLAAGLAAAPLHDDVADEAVFLARDCEHQARWYALTPAARAGAPWLAVIFLSVVGVAWAASLFAENVLFTLAAAGAVALLLLPSALPADLSYIHLSRWLVQRSFLHFCLGEGIYPKPVFLTAGGLILWFALNAFAFSVFSPSMGELVDGKNNAVTGRPKWVATTEPKSPQPKLTLEQYTLGFGRCLYYSTVTFTTLGYGDYLPQGRLKFFAAAEALAGAVMVALLTVIFARKYLRL